VPHPAKQIFINHHLMLSSLTAHQSPANRQRIAEYPAPPGDYCAILIRDWSQTHDLHQVLYLLLRLPAAAGKPGGEQFSFSIFTPVGPAG
jgi:hypothetical protein